MKFRVVSSAMLRCKLKLEALARIVDVRVDGGIRMRWTRIVGLLWLRFLSNKGKLSNKPDLAASIDLGSFLRVSFIVRVLLRGVYSRAPDFWNSGCRFTTF